jgi:calcineurin-like phosphoesterase family protein
MKRLKFEDGSKVYYTSDPHYGHVNICRGTTSWDRAGENIEESTRDFKTLEEMNSAIVDGINSTVGQDDELFCLGDWAFGNQENIRIFRNRIVCRNVHLIYGNHDKHIQDERRGFQSLFKTIADYGREISVGGEMMVLCHYAHRVWNKSHRGAIHLYGHSHSGLENEPNGKSIDVGIDNAFKVLGQYRPFSHAEIMNIMKKREVHAVDHHKGTNME